MDNVFLDSAGASRVLSRDGLRWRESGGGERKTTGGHGGGDDSGNGITSSLGLHHLHSLGLGLLDV